MNAYFPTIGRILLGLIFVASGFNKVMQFEGTQQYMEANGLPATAILLVGAIIFELGGGLMVILGFKARTGSLALVLFLIPTTLVFHTNFAEQTQVIQFMKNLAIMGGLLYVAAHGAGPAAIENDSVSSDVAPS
ncbi:DoxX family protein [Longibacter salinarum]|uniref:DoxX family protein n=2 Tax=Longibacter salinarum TaxID=1850348 RepID=A0A2A8CZU6_9BACT|nr:DoxX family protein [Longibacter salinarum]